MPASAGMPHFDVSARCRNIEKQFKHFNLRNTQLKAVFEPLLSVLMTTGESRQCYYDGSATLIIITYASCSD